MASRSESSPKAAGSRSRKPKAAKPPRSRGAPLIPEYPEFREDRVFRRDATPELLARMDRVTAELAQNIAERSPHPHLRWSRAGKVRLRVQAIVNAASLPRMGTSRGDRGLRRHLWRSVDSRLRGRGWRLNQWSWWEPPNYRRSEGGRKNLADQLAKSVRRGEQDERLEWKGRTRVRIRPKVSWSRSRNRPPADWIRALKIDLARRVRHLGWRMASDGWLHYTDPTGVIGWWYSYRGVGHFVRCLDCGRRVAFNGWGSSRPLYIDEIRPQPQHCHRCGKTMVQGILEGKRA